MRHSSNLNVIDAFSSAVHTAPSLIRTSQVLGGLWLCEWHTPPIDGFELPQTEDLTLALHRGGSHEVRVMHAGVCSRKRSVPGLFTLIPPGVEISYRTGGAVSFATLHVPRAALRTVLGKETQLTSDRFAFADPFLSACVASLLREARSPDGWTARFVEAVTQAMMLQLARASAATSPPPEPDPAARISAAQQKIDECLEQDLSVGMLAAHVGLSRAHFSRAFQRATGEAPHRFIIRRRIERSLQLLRETRLPLSEISNLTGFCSQSHFTRVFGERTGLTPQAYRQRCVDTGSASGPSPCGTPS